MEKAPVGYETVVTIPGEFPDLNQLIGYAKIRKGRWCKYNDVKRDYEDLIRVAVHQACPKYIHETYQITTTFYVKNRRKDPTNIVSAAEKIILDGFQKAGLVTGDGWKNVKPPKTTWWEVDKENPRIEITLTEKQRSPENER